MEIPVVAAVEQIDHDAWRPNALWPIVRLAPGSAPYSATRGPEQTIPHRSYRQGLNSYTPYLASPNMPSSGPAGLG